jgi:1-deoxy-D-xylulose-5-phosphate synthase
MILEKFNQPQDLKVLSNYAFEAVGDNPEVGVINARFIKPLDRGMLEMLALEGYKLVAVEDHQ